MLCQDVMHQGHPVSLKCRLTGIVRPAIVGSFTLSCGWNPAGQAVRSVGCKFMEYQSWQGRAHCIKRRSYHLSAWLQGKEAGGPGGQCFQQTEGLARPRELAGRLL